MWQQSLEQVLFLHWPVADHLIRTYLPAMLALDTYDGQAWVSLVVLRMKVSLTRLPWIQLSFPQVNLRTYVRHGDTPGIWFFSVHAHHYLAASSARYLTPIPYVCAPVHYRLRGSLGCAQARCRQRCHLDLHVTFSLSGSPPTPGPLDKWLLERYHLFALDRHGRLRVGEFQHPPWLTSSVRVMQSRLRAAPFTDLPFISPPALAHFSPGTNGTFGDFFPVSSSVQRRTHHL